MYPYVALIVFVLGLFLVLVEKMPPMLARVGIIFVWLGLGCLLAQIVHAVPLHFPPG